jgi:hypothetical protein
MSSYWLQQSGLFQKGFLKNCEYNKIFVEVHFVAFNGGEREFLCTLPKDF